MLMGELRPDLLDDYGLVNLNVHYVLLGKALDTGYRHWVGDAFVIRIS